MVWSTKSPHKCIQIPCFSWWSRHSCCLPPVFQELAMESLFATHLLSSATYGNHMMPKRVQPSSWYPIVSYPHSYPTIHGNTAIMYVYIYTYVYMYVCIYIYMYVCIYIYISVCVSLWNMPGLCKDYITLYHRLPWLLQVLRTARRAPAAGHSPTWKWGLVWIDVDWCGFNVG